MGYGERGMTAGVPVALSRWGDEMMSLDMVKELSGVGRAGR